MKKNLGEITLRDGRVYLEYNQFKNPQLSVDITPVWHFFKDCLLNSWTVEDFKREQEDRIAGSDRPKETL